MKHVIKRMCERCGKTITCESFRMCHDCNAIICITCMKEHVCEEEEEEES